MIIILNMLHYGIVMRQLMKRYLRTTATVMKIRERILRRTCFEIRKNKSDFYVSTICGRFERGPRANTFNAFSLIRLC